MSVERRDSRLLEIKIELCNKQGLLSVKWMQILRLKLSSRIESRLKSSGKNASICWTVIDRKVRQAE